VFPAVRCVMTKWGGRPHWEFDAVRLGTDEHGDWVGVPAGTPMLRPGAAFTPPVDSVVLVPSGARARDRPWWLATFYAPGFRVEVYVDVTAPARWDGPVLRAVDLDLDVVRGETGRVWVDDEDEFALHRVELGYPEDVVRAASRSCDDVHAMVRDRVAPFDGLAPASWLALLTG
jgi:uncharacterized protein